MSGTVLHSISTRLESYPNNLAVLSSCLRSVCIIRVDVHTLTGKADHSELENRFRFVQYVLDRHPRDHTWALRLRPDY